MSCNHRIFATKQVIYFSMAVVVAIICFLAESLYAINHSHLTISHYNYSHQGEDISIRYGTFVGSDDYYHVKDDDHILLFMLGRGEWLEKYIEVYDLLYQKLGRAVVIFDYQGQGGSSGVRGHIGSYDQYVAAYLSFLADHYPNKSYSIVGHSMGGMIALYGTLTGQLTPDKIVLSSPLLKLRKKPVPRFVAKPLSHLATGIGLGKIRTNVKSEIDYPFEENRLTSDREKYYRFRSTPYPIPSPSMAWVRATFQASYEIFQEDNMKRNLVPTLIFLGGQEYIVSPEGILEWVTRANQLAYQSVDLVYFPTAKHEIFFERFEITDHALFETANFLSH